MPTHYLYNEGLNTLKTLKKALPLVCAVTLFCLLSACGGSASVRDDVAVTDVTTAIVSALGDKDAFVSAPETFITGSMKMDVSDYEAYDIQINSKGVNIDEFGVFKATDSTQVAAIEQAVKAYLQMREDTWMTEYMPEEHPKLQNAEVKTAGNYVMYAILSDSGKEKAFNTFKKSLKA